MKRKSVVGLIGIVVIATVAMFAGCVENKEASTQPPSKVLLVVNYRISASSSGTYERRFNRADITDEELHEIAWDFIVAEATEKGIDPNGIVYDVKIHRFHTTQAPALPPPEPTRDARDYDVPFPQPLPHEIDTRSAREHYDPFPQPLPHEIDTRSAREHYDPFP